MCKRATHISICLAVILSIVGAAGAHADAPRAPNQCTAGSGTNGFSFWFVVHWRDRSQNEEGFIVEHWAKRSGVWVLEETAQAEANQTGVVLNFYYGAQEHRFRVRAYNGDGMSRWSNWARL